MGTFGNTAFNVVSFGGPTVAPPTPPPAGDLKQSIVAALGADASFTAIASSNLYPTVVPQTNSGPCVVYSIGSSQHVHNLQGAAGLQRKTVDLEIQAATTAIVEAVEKVLRDRLQGLIGSLAGLAISFVAYETEADGYYEPIPGSDLGTHWKTVSYTFTYRESIPSLS